MSKEELASVFQVTEHHEGKGRLKNKNIVIFLMAGQLRRGEGLKRFPFIKKKNFL